MADQDALGLIETRGLVAALEAADAALKAASVRLMGIKKTVPALMTVQVVGETAAVRSAVDAGRAAAERVGTVVATHVIPRPDREVARMQDIEHGGSNRPAQKTRPPGGSAGTKSVARPKPGSAARTKTRAATLDSPSSTTPGDLESMTVRELRSLARKTENFPIQGRAVARANKAQLLKAFGR